MENKQIIVDDVDVSGCEFCEWKGSNIPQCRIRLASFETTCKGYHCYYKQLAREKQSSQEARGTSIKALNRAEVKEQECEELKKTIMYECPQCGEKYLSPIGASLYEENNKLKQTLAEIKEITEPYKMTIKKICGNCKKYDDCHACCYKDINCYKYTSSETDACEEFTYLDEFVPNLLANNILQKIRECDTENEQITIKSLTTT